uniref:Uncharacterized protein n=1 Tax=Romanomermis culicivorax TaxID=13658 RepID=A0A915ICJ7_ROMCU
MGKISPKSIAFVLKLEKNEIEEKLIVINQFEKRLKFVQKYRPSVFLIPVSQYLSSLAEALQFLRQLSIVGNNPH